MLSNFDFKYIYLTSLKQGTSELALRIKEIQRKLIVSKTSDIVLLAKFKFSEWDQDGMVCSIAEGNTKYGKCLHF